MTERTNPLRPVIFEVLLILNDGDQHGYGIMKHVNDRVGGSGVLGPGTLYRTLKELRDQGLIEHGPSPEGADPRRQYYRITEAGRGAARREAQRISELVEIARSGRLLDPAESS